MSIEDKAYLFTVDEKNDSRTDKRPFGINICAIWFAFVGGFFIFMGIVVLFSAVFNMTTVVPTSNLNSLFESSVALLLFSFLIISFGIFNLATALGIWKLKRWARTVGIILAVVDLPLGVIILAVVDLPLGGVIFSIITLYFLLKKDIKKAFTEQKPNDGVDKPTGIVMCAILSAIEGLLGILGGVAMLLMEGANTEATGIFTAMFGIFAVIYIILGVTGLAIAYGIWNMKRWAKIGGIILAIIGGVLGFPIGTIIGIVILYFLLIDKNTKDLFIE